MTQSSSFEKFYTKRIGHGGTLDPDVVGVLPIAVGKATRVIEYMTEAGKSLSWADLSWFLNNDRRC